MLWCIPLIWWIIAANRKGILTDPPYNQLLYCYLSIYQLLEMCLAWNKAAVIQTSFRYSLQKGILVSLHVLLLTEFINTTLWIAVESSVVHAYTFLVRSLYVPCTFLIKNSGWSGFNFLEGLCGECWKVMWIHTIPLCYQGRIELWR